jgi:uncharacterized protein (DUF885 family)
MTKSLRILACLFVCACGSSGGGGNAPSNDNNDPPPPVDTPPVRDAAAVEAFSANIQDMPLEEYYAVAYVGLLSRTPQDVVWLGLEEEAGLADDALNSLAEGYLLDTTEMFTIALDALRSYDRDALSPRGQIDYDVFEWYLTDEIERASFPAFGFPATYGNFGLPTRLQRFFTDIHPLETVADAEAWIARLGQVDRQLDELADLLRRQAAAGVIEPRFTFEFSAERLANVAAEAAADSAYLTAFSERIEDIAELDDIARVELVGRVLEILADEVIPAYGRLVDTMNELVLRAPSAIGVSQFPDGDAYYAYELRHHTTTELTPVEVHEIGLAELERIQAEMRALFDTLGYPEDESLFELFERVANDGGIVVAADGLATFENLVAGAEAMLPDGFDIAPSIPVVVTPDPFGGFYIGPSLDGSRPGSFYAGTKIDQPYYLMPSLTYHESVPGHHMQIGIAADQDVPTFRKVVRSTGYVEGWALYAERLAKELGWYDNDIYGDLGRLQYEALRAARLVLDTGIHSSEYNFVFNRAADFNHDNTGFSVSSSQGATARYSISPGQASGYLVGMLRILEERERAQTELGADFDLKAFHRAVLTAGSVPLDVLPTVVDAYIAEVQGGG